MNQISLNSSMRSNLLSLQQTQALQDMTQLRLSTGLKVNSAIDNPSNYYTASSLSNRAKDLSSLLDAMSQGIQTIKAASETLTTATKFLEQAKAVAVKASESGMDIIAKVKTEDELLAAVNSGKTGYIVIAGDMTLTNTVELKDNQNLVGDNYFKEYNGANRKLNFDFTGKSGDAILAGNNSKISNLDIDYQTDQNYAFKVIAIIKKQKIEISNINLNATANKIVAGKEVSLINFLSSSGKITGDVNINSNVNFYGYGIQLTSNSKIDISANVNIKTAGNYGYGILTAISSTSNLYGKVNIETQNTYGSGLIQFHGANVNIYGEVNIKTKNTVGIFNRNEKVLNPLGNTCKIYSGAKVYLETGTEPAFRNSFSAYPPPNQLLIQKDAQIGIKDSIGTTFSKTLKDWEDNNNSTTIPNNFKSSYFSTHSDFTNNTGTSFDFSTMIFNQNFRGGSESKETNEGKQYNSILDQYNQLINDAGYKGINLLLSQDLKVNFNEERSSKIDVKGVDASTRGLGLTDAKWQSQTDIQKSLDEISSAINQIRSQSSEFGNFYSVVNSRIDFTDNLLNVLTEGSDKLTLADMNESSANMLALQTRQQLAINALSLANQASQSVLRLF